MRRRTPSLKNLALIGLLVSLPFWLGSSILPRDAFSRQLHAAVRPYAFSLFRWEVTSLAFKLQRRLAGADQAARLDDGAQVRLVREYQALVQQSHQLQDEQQLLYARATPADEARLRTVEAEMRQLQERRQAIEGQVENVLGRQIGQTLRSFGLREHLVDLHLAWAIPPVQAALTPDVFFKFERLPLLLVIAPRDRIAVRTSLFLHSSLGLEQMQQVEDQVDTLGVASITLPLGGFAAYPSMIPAGDSLTRNLNVIAHEWAHHYLALRPLGFRYFSSYEMRTINETVADMVGEEVGRAVYERYYASTAEAADNGIPQPQRSEQSNARPDFGTRMRTIRQEVEGYLTRGDVPGAEQYMESARKQLVADGFPVRKLNTAYLSFFGAYSGAGNPYEPGLRKLRQRTGSLKDFLDVVARIGSPQDFDKLVPK